MIYRNIIKTGTPFYFVETLNTVAMKENILGHLGKRTLADSFGRCEVQLFSIILKCMDSWIGIDWQLPLAALQNTPLWTPHLHQ